MLPANLAAVNSVIDGFRQMIFRDDRDACWKVRCPLLGRVFRSNGDSNNGGTRALEQLAGSASACIQANYNDFPVLKLVHFVVMLS